MRNPQENQTTHFLLSNLLLRHIMTNYQYLLKYNRLKLKKMGGQI